MIIYKRNQVLSSTFVSRSSGAGLLNYYLLYLLYSHIPVDCKSIKFTNILDEGESRNQKFNHSVIQWISVNFQEYSEYQIQDGGKLIQNCLNFA